MAILTRRDKGQKTKKVGQMREDDVGEGKDVREIGKVTREKQKLIRRL